VVWSRNRFKIDSKQNYLPERKSLKNILLLLNSAVAMFYHYPSIFDEKQPAYKALRMDLPLAHVW